MDYIGNKCPVCDKYFHADDDIVVCPECGTPHHRECYEKTGHCCHEDLHASGYDYQTDTDCSGAETKRCPSCGKDNDPDNFFCNYCGAPLSSESAQNTQTQQPPPGGAGMPFGAGFGGGQNGGAFNVPFTDPLGGVPADTDLGDGVTAGEAAKYVKQNTPYFIRIFNNIRSFNKSKFNFSAALFTGGYMLYRKMYKTGALFTLLQAVLMGASTYLTVLYYYYLGLDSTDTLYGSTEIMSSLLGLSDTPLTGLTLVYLLLTLVSVANIALRIVCGILFNKMYFKHCKKQILAVKASANSDENPETVLQTKGGVNTALAISLAVAYLVISFLPNLIGYFT